MVRKPRIAWDARRNWGVEGPIFWREYVLACNYIGAPFSVVIHARTSMSFTACRTPNRGPLETTSCREVLSLGGSLPALHQDRAAGTGQSRTLEPVSIGIRPMSRSRKQARFDEWGLWRFRKTCFSRHGNLPQTIQALVERASGGCTLKELERLLDTRVHNHVSRLLREGKLTRFSLGRYAVYLASEPRRQAEQWTTRQQEIAPIRVGDRPRPDVPPGLEPVTVIRVLVRLLETPEASLASVARRLQAREIDVRADQIRQILDFYGLKKNDSLRIAALIQQLRVASQQALENQHVPDGICHRFDRVVSGKSGGKDQATTCRYVKAGTISGHRKWSAPPAAKK